MNSPINLLTGVRKVMRPLLTLFVLALTAFIPVQSTLAAEATGDLFVTSFVGQNVTRLDGSTGDVVYDVSQGASTINLAKGPDGQLYVSTLFTSNVSVTDLETGAPLGIFAEGGGLNTATGVTFGPDGQLYVGSRNTNSVLRYDGTTGAFVDVFVAPDSGGLAATEALVFGPDGHLYVTEFSGDRVLRFDGATGTFESVFASSPLLANARGLVFGPDGYLYVAGNASNNVVRFDAETGVFVDVFATDILGANGLAFGPEGDLYVAAELGNAILRFDVETGELLGTFATVTGPIGLFFDLAPPFNARQLKRDAIAALEPLLSGGDRKRIESAIAHLEASLDDAFWVDDTHLTAEGRRVFDAERKAVHELRKIKNADPIVAEVMASLLEIDATLARIAVEEAAEAGGAARFLKVAERFLNRGDHISGPNREERAIQAYRSAWIAAFHAVRELPPGHTAKGHGNGKASARKDKPVNAKNGR